MAGVSSFEELIAKASCAEVRSQLYVALDSGYLGSSEFSELMTLTNEVGRIVNGLRLSIKKRLNN